MTTLDWTHNILRILELGTFANVWYWLVVIVTWSLASNWLIGVPFDVLFRARRAEDGQELADLEGLTAIHVRRIANYHRTLGPWMVGLVAFLLSGLMLMGFFYAFELAQGLFVLGAPLCIIAVINLRLALQLERNPLYGRALVRRLFMARLWTQIIAMTALFFTAMYGMYYSIEAQHFL